MPGGEYIPGGVGGGSASPDETLAHYQPVASATSLANATETLADAGHQHQGVSQIVAGSNVTITSTDSNGHGQVQINSTASGTALGVTDLGTVGSGTVTLSPAAVWNATLTTGTATPFVLPSTATMNGASSILRLTNAASGTFQNPTFTAHSGDTLVVLAQPNWNPAAGAVNELVFNFVDNTTAGGSNVVEMFPLLGAVNLTTVLQPVITPTGAGWSNLSPSGSSWTLPVSPATVGDVLVVAIGNYASLTVSSISGGGVTTWNLLSPASTGTLRIVLAWGIVTTAGAATITAVMSSSSTSGEIFAQELTKTSGAFIADGGSATGLTSGPVLNLASLSPTNPQEAYVAAYYINATPTVGTQGYTVYPASCTQIGLLINTNVAITQAPQLYAPGASEGISVSQLLAA